MKQSTEVRIERIPGRSISPWGKLSSKRINNPRKAIASHWRLTDIY